MIDPTGPAREFAKKLQEEYERFADETAQLDQAFLSGRVGQLIKKWQAKFAPKGDEDGDETDQQPGQDDMEGEGGGSVVETETG